MCKEKNEKESEITKYFYDVEALDNLYCNNNDCHSCDGTDMSGEPNGYGCDLRDQWVLDTVESGHYEEIPTDENNLKLFVSLEDYEKRIDLLQEEIKCLKK